jgi:hypothetical protein
MDNSFRDAFETLVNQRIVQGADPRDLFEKLTPEANPVFGHYNMEFELGLLENVGKPD